jgi:hypothetical protein
MKIYLAQLIKIERDEWDDPYPVIQKTWSFNLKNERSKFVKEYNKASQESSSEEESLFYFSEVEI